MLLEARQIYLIEVSYCIVSVVLSLLAGICCALES